MAIKEPPLDGPPIDNGAAPAEAAPKTVTKKPKPKTSYVDEYAHEEEMAARENSARNIPDKAKRHEVRSEPTRTKKQALESRKFRDKRNLRDTQRRFDPSTNLPIKEEWSADKVSDAELEKYAKLENQEVAAGHAAQDALYVQERAEGNAAVSYRPEARKYTKIAKQGAKIEEQKTVAENAAQGASYSAEIAEGNVKLRQQAVEDSMVARDYGYKHPLAEMEERAPKQKQLNVVQRAFSRVKRVFTRRAGPSPLDVNGTSPHFDAITEIVEKHVPNAAGQKSELIAKIDLGLQQSIQSGIPAPANREALEKFVLSIVKNENGEIKSGSQLKKIGANHIVESAKNVHAEKLAADLKIAEELAAKAKLAKPLEGLLARSGKIFSNIIKGGVTPTRAAVGFTAAVAGLGIAEAVTGGAAAEATAAAQLGSPLAFAAPADVGVGAIAVPQAGQQVGWADQVSALPPAAPQR